MSRDTLELGGRGEGTDIRGEVEGRALGQARDACREGGRELVGDLAVDVDALDRYAQLAHRREAAVDGAGCGLRGHHVVEHDEGVLATQLQRGAVEGLRRALADLRARGGGAGEADVVGGIHDRIADLVTGAGNHGPERGGYAGFDERAARGEDRQGALVVGLLHDTIAGGEGRHDVHERERQRVVPGRDDADEPLGLVADAGLHDDGDRRTATVPGEDAASLHRVVASDVRALEDLLEGLTAGLAGLRLQDVEQVVPALQQQVVSLQQHRAAVGVARGTPRDGGGAGGCRGIRHVTGTRQRQLVQHLAGEGRDDGSGGAGRRGEVAREWAELDAERPGDRGFGHDDSLRSGAVTLGR